ncbi:hypothetical protein GCM10010384_56970 [Streptomyces djakartensis]|uniref:Uncharacterized protein n=1 Tax=Streptomyces djakartensis TaxID=68193 RepID=A0ABQ3AAZ4_9ACTN|nr:hypothetical protein GCM10010384_56970 [Streptomyces djakartensis]
MHFMRISNQHHSMAIAKGPHTSLHHVSFEMRGLDEYMRGSGRVMRAGAEITVDGGLTAHGGVKSISDALSPAAADSAASSPEGNRMGWKERRS